MCSTRLAKFGGGEETETSDRPQNVPGVIKGGPLQENGFKIVSYNDSYNKLSFYE